MGSTFGIQASAKTRSFQTGAETMKSLFLIALIVISIVVAMVVGAVLKRVIAQRAARRTGTVVKGD